MNILKNFEAVFVVTMAAAVAACGVAPGASTEVASQVRTVDVATPTTMAVVTVTAKRMSAIEKQRSLEDERRLAKQGAAGSRI
jgi:Zn-dependent alcohol dehydrogenase